MQSDWWLQLILPKKCARCFFLLSKNISCTETACLLLRIISLFKFLGVLEPQNFLASKNSCNEYFVEQTQISLVLKSFWFGNSRPALKNYSSEFQNYRTSSSLKYWRWRFSWANTNQVKCWKLQYNQQYFFEFCIHWESYICGQVNFYILSANQECRLLCLLADRVSKISRGWL